MSFNPPTTTAAGSFSFGLTSTPAAPAATKPPTFSFGAPTAGTGTGGGDADTAKPATLGMGTGPAAAAPASSSFMSAPQPAATTAPPSFNFAAPAATAAPPKTAAPAFGFAGAAPAATTSAAAPSFNFGGGTATTAAVSTAPALSLQKTAAPTLSLGAAPVATSSSGGGFASLTTATKTTDSTAVVNASHITYNQLEEHINKWTLELEDQEKLFTDQATQINAWDKILINNNQKILELNDAVQKVKLDQQTLEQELEFIATQHKELEESIMPLQKEFMKIPQVDMERSQTYLLIENLDTQLKQMSEDLKEIIDNLNESNKGQDNTDPIIQIGKILNAHMSSLQWIESSSSTICNKLEDITKMHENYKRDSERSFRSAYYN